MDLNVTGFQPAINELDEPIPPFGAVQIVGVKLNDATGLTSLRVQTPDVNLTRVDPLRPNPELIGINSSHGMPTKGDRGLVTFADVAVAQVTRTNFPIAAGTLVYSLTGEPTLRPPELVLDKPTGQSVQEFKRRVLGVFRIVAPLQENEVVSGKTAFLVHRLPNLTRLVQAVADVDEGESGVFRCHSISGVTKNSEITMRAGEEDETGVYVRAFNRIGEVSTDDWRYLTFVDGVLTVMSGGGGGCLTQQYAITVLGDPTAGSFDLRLDFVTGSSETITIDFDDDRTAVYDKLAALTGIKDADGNVPASLAVRGGPLPDWTMTIRIPTDGAGGGLDGEGGGVLEVLNNTLSGGIRCRVRLAAVCCG